MYVCSVMHAVPHLAFAPLLPQSAPSSAKSGGSGAGERGTGERSGGDLDSKDDGGKDGDGEDEDEEFDDDEDKHDGELSTKGTLLGSLAASAGTRPDPLSWVFHRTSFLARKPGHEKRLALFRFFAAVCSTLPVAAFSPYLVHMLSPLLRISASAPGSIAAASDSRAVAFTEPHIREGAESELRALIGEVLEVVEAAAGHDAFASAYSQIRSGLQRGRDTRKRKRVLEKAVARSVLSLKPPGSS